MNACASNPNPAQEPWTKEPERPPVVTKPDKASPSKTQIKTHRTFLTLLLAVSLAACAGTSTRESTGEYVDDTVLTTKVKSAFAADKAVDALDIKVETFKGTVQLSGFADSQSEIDRAVSIARSTSGVKTVQNAIRLKSTR